MKKNNLWIIIILVVVIGASMIIYSQFQNPSPPKDKQVETSCSVDRDCVLAVPEKLLECNVCDPYNCKMFEAKEEKVIAISASWDPSCPEIPEQTCIACIGGIHTEGYEAKCVENICKKVKS